ncbi:MarR family transcriptional regulator [Ligilactobacillus acidipiscis DSM 15836]|jgi:DNA-binding HxlR family transcriptional regulator|uniref:Helix-turn-helix transcriptional regulator n=2 Tax=Ligilactobacillus acidipiscis TaxID=89059 RepID=A0A0R2K4N6_9LACO|nr:helix-turn-helix domain-containing protein [Ligilactobacillus acidipiscis]KRM27229.1 MarR family transcriptional regulator [Ligilactobacillus acidipiscis DSM 15836]KRN81076.1 MarR family transcriptional regulator [Ligilactobacillus acidipiscis]MCI1924247.1 helix-turn-helix transcriptional regulator [Ligilactobacillus acidipiscis]MCI1953975.1 helix-turn-helix transcriptional regulator [Ligilactobacillus acidipiscis]WEV58040.1 helix-turn-helix domain-containing protein [Ligilactobacillus acid
MAVEIQKDSDYKLCPRFEKTFGILGKKWNGLIIDVLLSEGPQRFKDIANSVNKCSDRVLVERLKELENEGLVTKTPLEDSCRDVYQLTEQGEDLAGIIGQVHGWAEKWYTLADCTD